MPDLPRRTVIREHEFDEQLRALIVDMEEADEFTAGAEDLLARHPESGMPAAHDRSVWYLPMSPVRGQRVSLFYGFDESTVVFLAILPFDD
jgi:hypothetical protein